MTKQIVTDKIYGKNEFGNSDDIFSIYDLDEKDLHEVVAFFQKLLDDWKKAYETYDNLKLRLEVDNYDLDVWFEGERLETDEEEAYRLASEKQRKSLSKTMKDAKDRNDYERLKKKFEGYLILDKLDTP